MLVVAPGLQVRKDRAERNEPRLPLLSRLVESDQDIEIVGDRRFDVVVGSYRVANCIPADDAVSRHGVDHSKGLLHPHSCESWKVVTFIGERPIAVRSYSFGNS